MSVGGTARGGALSDFQPPPLDRGQRIRGEATVAPHLVPETVQFRCARHSLKLVLKRDGKPAAPFVFWVHDTAIRTVTQSATNAAQNIVSCQEGE